MGEETASAAAVIYGRAGRIDSAMMLTQVYHQEIASTSSSTELGLLWTTHYMALVPTATSPPAHMQVGGGGNFTTPWNSVFIALECPFNEQLN